MEDWVGLRSTNGEGEMLRLTMPPARLDIK